MKRVTVYCASSPRIRQIYFDVTERLANQLFDNGIEVVFGGGAKGLMGKLADVIVARGGKIKGIMPQFMNDVEWAHKAVDNFEFTQTMHERKAKLIEDIDGLIALPGGCGTFEELLEAITLKRLGLYTKPIVILNTEGFYKPLKMLLENSIKENFMAEIHRDMWTFVDEPEDIIPALRNAASWDSGAIAFAAVK